MAIFHCYVSSPEGNQKLVWFLLDDSLTFTNDSRGLSSETSETGDSLSLWGDVSGPIETTF